MAKKKSISASRRALAFFFAFSIIFSGATVAPGGPIGQVAASHADCSEVDEFFWVLSIGLLNDQCDSSALSDHADELEDAMENATKTEIYNTGAQTKADSDQYLAVLGNYLQDSGTPAMAKAEAAAVEAIDNGDSRSEVEAAAVEAVEDYYTKKQMNLLDQWNVAAETAWTMENTSDAAGLAESFVSHNPKSTVSSADGKSITTEFNAIDTSTMTLVNGSTYQVTRLKITYYLAGTKDDPPSYVQPDQTNYDERGDMVVEVTGMRTDPISGQTSQEFINYTDYKNEWDEVESRNAQIEANAEEYAGALYNATQNGTANVSDYVSGATLATEYSTDYNSTGYYSYLVGYAATQGMAIPNLSTTSLMTIQTATNTYQGLIMSQEAPANGTWEVGVEYHTANIGGKQFVATTNGTIVELDGAFSITSMEDEEGNAVQSTTSQEFNYTVTNESSNYAELQDQIRSLQQEIQEIEPVGGSGGGGGGGIGFDLGGTGLVVVAAAAAAIILLGRN